MSTQETIVSKLRNQLTPMYSLPQVVINLKERPNDEILKSLIHDIATQAIKNQQVIKELLTQLEVIESKQL